MKFLVVLSLALSASAVPIEKDYLLPAAPPVAVVQPAAPVAVVNLPAAPAAVEPAALRFLNPLPIARAFPAPVAAPFVARAFPAPIAAPVPFAAAPAPIVRQVVPAPVATPLAVAAPIPAPVIPAPVAVPNSQFHAQDELGGFSFGYANGESAKQEVRTPDGVVRGSYSYVDANGQLQHVEYISDPVNGFRVAGTNLPVFNAEGVATPIVPAVAGPVPVQETAEVIAARAEFQKAFAAAVARNAENPIVTVEEPAVTATLALRKKREALENDYLVPAAPAVRVVPAPLPVALPSPAAIPVGVVRSHTVTPLVAPLHPSPLRAFAAPVPVPAPVAAPVLRQFVPAPVAAPLVRQVVPAPLPVAAPAPVATPLAAVAPAPVVPVPAPTVQSQFQAQDELGGFSFGYANDLSTRQESRSPDGVTRGSYSYVDANGITQKVVYEADAVNGFRIVEGTNLPVAPVA